MNTIGVATTVCIRPVRLDQVYRAPGPSRYRAVGGQRGRQLRQCSGETINGLYKAEVIHRRGPWRSFEAVEFATLEWIDWFNNRRLLEPIGYIPPAEAEERYYATLDQPAMAA
jgi:transposase InsO family protein